MMLAILLICSFDRSHPTLNVSYKVVGGEGLADVFEEGVILDGVSTQHALCSIRSELITEEANFSQLLAHLLRSGVQKLARGVSNQDWNQLRPDWLQIVGCSLHLCYKHKTL